MNQPTKYVLCGALSKARDQGKAFTEALTEGFNNPSILFCCFAKPEAEREEKRQEFEAMLAKFADIQQPITQALPETFLADIQRHDIVYLSGGNTPDLYKAMSAYSADPEFWKRTFAGKVVGGNSAGVNVLTKLSYNVDHEFFQEGLGVLNVASIVHFRSQAYNVNIDWSAAEESLRSRTNLPLLLLEEGEFTVVTE